MSDSRTVLEEAKALVAAGTPTEAIRRLVAWTSGHPDDVTAWELLARVHFDLHHWLPARMAATQVTRLRPESALAWCNLGTILRKMERPEEAGEAQRRALQLDPACTRAQAELAKLQRTTGPEPEEAPPAQQMPAAEAAPEFETPYYCRQCRRKIPRAVSDENEGLCGTCLRAQVTSEAEVVDRPGLFGVPMWAIGAAVILVLFLGTTFGLVVGRRGHHQKAEANKGTEEASASRETPAGPRGAGQPPTASRRQRTTPRAYSPPSTAQTSARSSSGPAPTRGSTMPASPAADGSSTAPTTASSSGRSSGSMGGSGSIKGTVTYYFNSNYGDKPDSGTKVYVLAGIVRECPPDLFFLSTESEARWVQPSNGPQGQSTVLYRMPVHAYTIADGNGNFSIERLPSGPYTVVLESAHAEGMSYRDISGIHTWKFVQVRAGAVVDVSTDFGMTWH